MKKLGKKHRMHDQFHILAAVLAQWRRPVASIVSLDPLSWVISLALYWRTATVSETADKYGPFCRFFWMRPWPCHLQARYGANTHPMMVSSSSGFEWSPGPPPLVDDAASLQHISAATKTGHIGGAFVNDTSFTPACSTILNSWVAKRPIELHWLACGIKVLSHYVPSRVNWCMHLRKCKVHQPSHDGIFLAPKVSTPPTVIKWFLNYMGKFQTNSFTNLLLLALLNGPRTDQRRFSIWRIVWFQHYMAWFQNHLFSTWLDAHRNCKLHTLTHFFE